MENIENIQKELKNILSEKRYLHSIGVMKMAENLAKQYGIDEKTASLTGLVHDIGKELSLEESMQYIKENNITIDEIEKQNPQLLHAKIGANIAKNKYGFTEEMQKAIMYHTTGNPKMDKLAKVIYVADKSEETRQYSDIEYIRKLAFQDLDEALLYILNFDIKKNIEQGRMIHPDSIFTRNAILVTVQKL